MCEGNNLLFVRTNVYGEIVSDFTLKDKLFFQKNEDFGIIFEYVWDFPNQ